MEFGGAVEDAAAAAVVSLAGEDVFFFFGGGGRPKASAVFSANKSSGIPVIPKIFNSRSPRPLMEFGTLRNTVNINLDIVRNKAYMSIGDTYAFNVSLCTWKTCTFSA